MQGTTPPPSPPLPPFPVQSAKRLNATSEWRLTVRPEAVVCKACAKSSRSHYMHVVGHCSQGRPIIYSCLVGGGGRDGGRSALSICDTGTVEILLPSQSI